MDEYYYTDWGIRRRANIKEWCQKPFVIKNSPFDLTLYYDCDHVFYKDLDLSIFNVIDEHELVSAIPVKTPKRAKVILNELANAGIKLNKLQSFSGACIGVKKGSEYLEKVIERLPILTHKGGRILKRNPEEFSFSSVINEGYGTIVDRKWSSDSSGDKGRESTLAIHYPKKRFIKEPRWYAFLDQVKQENYLGFKDYWETPGVKAR
jgi:hypothetical protein